MQKTVEIDFLSEDANIRQQSVRWLKQEQERPSKRERMKRVIADLSKPKVMAATAGR